MALVQTSRRGSRAGPLDGRTLAFIAGMDPEDYGMARGGIMRACCSLECREEFEKTRKLNRRRVRSSESGL